MAVSPVLSITIDADDKATPTIKNIESSIIRFVGSVSAALATIKTIAFPVGAAANLQTELLNVGKTTNFTTDQLEQLRKGLIEVSQRMNVTAVDLAKIAAAGGQMGLGQAGVDGLMAFTETAARFSSVLDVSAEEAGNGIAKLSNIFNVAVKDAERIGSLLNEISNNSTASGADLIDMVQRIGTAGGTIGIKVATALAATGRDLGLTVETVGTSFNKIFLDLQTKAPQVAQAMGVPVEAWSAKVRNDGVGALKEYLTFLSKMPAAQRAAFAEDTTGGGRIFALVTSLVNDASNGFTLLDRHLKEAQVGFDGGTSAIKEQERVLTGLQAQFQILKNVLTNVAETVGKEAMPYLTDMVKSLQEWAKQPEVINSLKTLGNYIGQAGKAMVGFVTALVPVLPPLASLVKLISIFVGFKIASTFAGMAASATRAAGGLIQTANAWRQVLTGNQQALTQASATMAQINAAATQAQAAGNAAGKAAATATAPLVTRVGAAINNIRTLTQNIRDNNQQIAALTQRYEGYAQRIAASTNGRQIGGLRSQMVYIDQQRQALQASNNALATQNGAAGRLAGSYVALTAAAAGANGVIGKTAAVASVAGTAILSLGSAFVGLLGRALSFISFWGAIVATVYSLADMVGIVDPVVNAFKRFFGITSESEAAIARREAVARAALAEEESRVRAVADGYKTLMDQIGNVNKVQLNFANALKLAPVAQAQVQRVSIDIQYEERNRFTLTDSLNAVKDEAAKVKVALAGISDGATDEKAVALREKLVSLLQQQANIERAIEASKKTSLDLALQQGDANNSMEAAYKAILSNYDAAGFKLVQMAAEQVKYRQEVEQTAKRMAELESRGANSSADSALSKEYAMVRGELASLQAQYKNYTDSFNAELVKSSLSAQRFFRAFIPDIDTANLTDLNNNIAAVESSMGQLGTVSQARLGDVKRQIEELTWKVSALNVQYDDLIKSGNKAGAMEVKGQAAIYENDLAKLKAIVQTFEVMKSAAKRASDSVGTSLPSSAEKSRKAVEELLKSFAKIGPLQELKAAQESVLRAATQVAADMKTKYESTFKEIQNRGEATFNALADIQRTLDLRGSTLANKALQQQQTKEAREYELAVKDQEAALRRQAAAQGWSRQELENALQAAQRMAGVQRRNFEAQQETARGEQEVATKLREKQYIQQKLEESMQKQIALQEQIKAAQAAGDNAKAAELAVQLGREADLADGYFKDLQKTIAELAKGMSGVTQGLAENGTLKFRYDDRAVQEATRGIDTLLPKLNEIEARSRQAAANASQTAATGAGQALEATTKEIDATKKAIDEFSKTAGLAGKDLANAINQMAEQVVKSQGAFKDMSVTLQQIANADLRTGTMIGGVKDLNNMMADIDRIASGLAAKLAINVDGSSVEALKKSLEGMGGVAIRVETGPAVSQVQNAMNTATFPINRVDASNVPGQVQNALSSQRYAIDVQANIIPNQRMGGPAGISAQSSAFLKFADGGHVRGSGTGISDSIAAMLSHGEYVMDAQTVRMFGSGFFRMLQQLGRSSTGFATLRKYILSANMPSLSLPRFASGGVVGSSFVSPGTYGAAAVGDKVELTINIGDGSYKVEGSRGQVRGLYNALRMLER